MVSLLVTGDIGCLKEIRQALERDMFRCAITGRVDIKSYQSGTLVVTNPANERSSAHTEAAHIFSPSINKNLDKNDKVG